MSGSNATQNPDECCGCGSACSTAGNEVINEEITARAKEIIASGKAFSHLYETWQKMHNGDKYIGKSLIISIPCNTVTNSKGIHNNINGEHGTGKTHAITCALKLLPKAQTFSGGISPKSLYGSKDIMPGTIIFIDEIVWNGDQEGLGQTAKRITAKFQEQDGRLTKDSTTSIMQYAPERLVFWTTSVDSQGDEQIRDRFIGHTTADNPERKNEIKKFMLKEAEGYEGVTVTKEKLDICKAITKNICSNSFNVVVPYATRIKISGDTRATAMFLDMIRNFAAYDYMNRLKDDKERLIATIDDFEAAKELYMGLGGHDPDKFTETEKKVLDAILEIQKESKDATISLIQERSDLSQPTVYNTIFGRKQGKGESHGLVHKCKELQVSRQHPMIVKLPADYNRGANVTVELMPQTNITSCNAEAATGSA